MIKNPTAKAIRFAGSHVGRMEESLIGFDKVQAD